MPAAALMVGARVVNLAVGIVAIPVLIRSLGGEGFSQWAILLALAAGFSLLELGMAPMVRQLAPAAAGGDERACRLVTGRMWVLHAITFGCGWAVVLALGPSFAAWTRMIATPLFSGAGLIALVFAAVALRSLLQGGYFVLMASRRFGAASAVSLLESLLSNIAAMAAAWYTHRVDLAVLAYWGARLAAVACAFAATWRWSVPRFDASSFAPTRLWEMVRFSVSTQSEGWSQFVNFQFDKFIIAGWVGLWAVSPYEVANRAVAALRSIPASGADSFLPMALSAHESPQGAWPWYEASMRLAAYGVVVFVVAPLAIAPVFLYAWTGEMGYLGRWVFTALALGSAASVLALPAAALVQAAGQPALQARAALLSLAANVVLSLSLVWLWGQLGAAVGTGIAMCVGAWALTRFAHRRFGQPLRRTLASLARFWPLAAVCVAWAFAVQFAFHAWFDGLPLAGRYARELRIVPALAAGAAYAALLATLFAVEALRGGFTATERARVSGWLRPLTARARDR